MVQHWPQFFHWLNLLRAWAAFAESSYALFALFQLKKKKRNQQAGAVRYSFMEATLIQHGFLSWGGRGSSQPFPGSSELSRRLKPQKYGRHVRFMKLLEGVVVSLQIWDSGDPALSR